ncbi:hypothetical protein D3C87_1912170 [compost metagenome]
MTLLKQRLRLEMILKVLKPPEIEFLDFANRAESQELADFVLPALDTGSTCCGIFYKLVRSSRRGPLHFQSLERP